MGLPTHIQAIPPFGQKSTDTKNQDQALKISRIHAYHDANHYPQPQERPQDKIRKESLSIQKQKEASARRGQE